MRAINATDSLTAREIEQFEQEKELAILQADYQVKYKAMELDLKRIETKWTQVFRLPFAVILLPVKLVFALGYIGHAVRGTQPSEKFWEFLGKL